MPFVLLIPAVIIKQVGGVEEGRIGDEWNGKGDILEEGFDFFFVLARRKFAFTFTCY
jgi:hypothetical protein